MKWLKTAAPNRKYGRSTALGREVFSGYIWMSPERVSVGDDDDEEVDA